MMSVFVGIHNTNYLLGEGRAACAVAGRVIYTRLIITRITNDVGICRYFHNTNSLLGEGSAACASGRKGSSTRDS